MMFLTCPIAILWSERAPQFGKCLPARAFPQRPRECACVRACVRVVRRSDGAACCRGGHFVTTRQNRLQELVPIRYEYVYRLKREMPHLHVVVNGEIRSVVSAHVVSVCACVRACVRACMRVCMLRACVRACVRV